MLPDLQRMNRLLYHTSELCQPSTFCQILFIWLLFISFGVADMGLALVYGRIWRQQRHCFPVHQRQHSPRWQCFTCWEKHGQLPPGDNTQRGLWVAEGREAKTISTKQRVSCSSLTRQITQRSRGSGHPEQLRTGAVGDEGRQRRSVCVCFHTPHLTQATSQQVAMPLSNTPSEPHASHEVGFTLWQGFRNQT